MVHTTTCSVPFAPQTARTIRVDLGDYLVREGVGRDAIDDALLVMTELVTNAIRHGRAAADDTLGVWWGLDGDQLDLVVRDEGGSRRRPTPERVSPEATRGRGLAIVESLTTEWWVDDPPGTAVHARLRVRCAPSTRPGPRRRVVD